MLGLPGGGEERRVFQITTLAGPAGGARPPLAAVAFPGLCLWRPEPPNSVCRAALDLRTGEHSGYLGDLFPRAFVPRGWQGVIHLSVARSLPAAVADP